MLTFIKHHSMSLKIYFWMLFTFSLNGCSRSPAQTNLDQVAAQPIEVQVENTKRENISRDIELTGTLAAGEEATISVEVDGRINAIQVDLGDHVRKGMSLAQIAPEDYQLRLTQAETDLAAAESDFKRIESLAVKKIAPSQQLDEGRRRLDLAKAAVDLARKKVHDTVLRAPFAGMVAKRMINKGEYVRVGTACFYLVRVNPLKFVGDVPERYSTIVKIGNPVIARPMIGDIAPLKGKVSRISPAVAQDTRSFTIEAQVENPEEKIKPGTFGRLTILTSMKDRVLLVPEQAVQTFAGNPRLFVIEGNRAHERPVTLGDEFGNRVEITKGLKEGEKIAINHVELLSENVLVKVSGE